MFFIFISLFITHHLYQIDFQIQFDYILFISYIFDTHNFYHIFPYLLYKIKPLIIFCAQFDHTLSFTYIFTHILMTWTFVWRRRHDTYGIGLLGSAARDTCDICGAAVVLCGRRSTCFT